MRHLIDTHKERLTDRHLTLRVFSVLTAGIFGLRRTHQEFARRNQCQPHRYAVTQIERGVHTGVQCSGRFDLMLASRGLVFLYFGVSLPPQFRSSSGLLLARVRLDRNPQPAVEDIAATTGPNAVINPSGEATSAPPPTAESTDVGLRSVLWINFSSSFVILRVLPVAAPFPEITMHIIQSPGIGGD